MLAQEFLVKLKEKTNLKISLKVKNYRSRIVSIVVSRFDKKICLHEKFLSSDEYIIQNLLDYCINQNKTSLKIIKNYANQNFFKNKIINEKIFFLKGICYNLQDIYDNLNTGYFDNKLNLKITFFKKPKYKKYRSITFGLYDDRNKLIKINKILDNEFIPFYFINYVVFHEMLHNLHPVTIDNNRRKVHTKEFKEKEKTFPYYNEAKEFEKKFIKKGKIDGWA